MGKGFHNRVKEFMQTDELTKPKESLVKYKIFAIADDLLLETGNIPESFIKHILLYVNDEGPFDLNEIQNELNGLIVYAWGQFFRYGTPWKTSNKTGPAYRMYQVFLHRLLKQKKVHYGSEYLAKIIAVMMRFKAPVRTSEILHGYISKDPCLNKQLMRLSRTWWLHNYNQELLLKKSKGN